MKYKYNIRSRNLPSIFFNFFNFCVFFSYVYQKPSFQQRRTFGIYFYFIFSKSLLSNSEKLLGSIYTSFFISFLYKDPSYQQRSNLCNLIIIYRLLLISFYQFRTGLQSYMGTWNASSKYLRQYSQKHGKNSHLLEPAFRLS